jgi:hypothetical protein
MNRIPSGTHSRICEKYLDTAGNPVTIPASSIISIFSFPSFNHLKHEIHQNNTTF